MNDKAEITELQAYYMKFAMRAAVYQRLCRDSVVLMAICVCFVFIESYRYGAFSPYVPSILAILCVVWFVLKARHKKCQRSANDLKVLVDQELSERIKILHNASRF